MASQTARVPTANAGKYIQQLCKHWSHKLEVDFDAEHGTVKFPDAVAEMKATPDALEVVLTAADEATVDRFKPVISSHLDRFAFREAPLSFDWQPVG